jgi:hypothetical protein
MHESGGRTNAQNPTSTAFGLGQLLIANREHYGKILGVSPNTTNYSDQLKMFRMYVSERYGNAANAQKFWQAHGWYDQGGMASGMGYMAKNTIKPERVLSPGQTASFNNLVKVLDRSSSNGQSSPAGGQSIDYRKLATELSKAVSGMEVKMDGKVLGKVLGSTTNILGRAG